MKKYIFLFTIFSFVYIFLNYASASSSFTQTIILKPGWNIISTPRILDSYSFSASSTSDNFDIYVLNPESPSGWSTMQDLGQTKLEPLFGYFINNKTGQDQNLILNYKQNVSPAERLFKREFKKTGWYSIGIANPTYSKTQYDDNLNDINNPLNILFSIKDKISSVIDFTYGNNSITSVSVSSNWKSANANDLNSLNDFRETKGYGIFINNPENALYEGFQNNDPVIDYTQSAPQATIEVSKNSGSPVENNVIADYATGRADKVALLKVDLIARSDRLQLIQLAGSSTAFGVSVSTVYLMDGLEVLDSAVVDSNHSYTFTNLLSQNIWVEKDTTKTLTIAADVTGATTTDAAVLATIKSVLAKNMLGDIIEQNDLSIIGNPLHVLTEAPMFAKGQTFNVSVVRDQNNSTTTANATLEVLVTAKGGNIKISSSTVFTLFWETNAGATSSVAKAASEVRDSSNNLVSQTSGYYVVPVNQTYKFVIQDQKPFPGAPRVRVKVDAITWQNSGNTNITSQWTGRDLITDWSN